MSRTLLRMVYMNVQPVCIIDVYLAHLMRMLHTKVSCQYFGKFDTLLP